MIDRVYYYDDVGAMTLVICLSLGKNQMVSLPRALLMLLRTCIRMYYSRAVMASKYIYIYVRRQLKFFFYSGFLFTILFSHTNLRYK